MDEYRFNSGSDLQIGRALEEINSWYYRGMGDFDIKRCQMWFNDNTACRQIYIVRIMYDLIKCDVYRFVVKADGSGMIDYIEFDPEFNEKAKRIAEFVRINGTSSWWRRTGKDNPFIRSQSLVLQLISIRD